ncbi:MAG: response regulator [Candidatus Omnitrophota bacterium]
MNGNEDKVSRIIVIDDNEEIFNDINNILVNDNDLDNLEEMENELFGRDARRITFVAPTEYELAYASQGQDGVAKIKQALAEGKPFCIAFVDMRLPLGWDGLETTRDIWKKDPDIQVVICTAFSDYSWEEIVDQVGCTDNLLILKKPFDHAEVSQIALAMTRKWQLARQAAIKMSELQEMVELRTSELKTAKEQAERANKNKTEFLSNISHEILTPMTAVIGMSEMLLKTPLNEEQKNYVDAIFSSGEGLLKVINDVMDITRLEAGEARLEVVAFNFKTIIEDATHMLMPRALEKGLALVLEFDPGAPKEVLGDALRVRQVVFNLVENALKFTHKGSIKIKVSAQGIRDSIGKFCIDVEDTGVGIEPGMIHFVFNESTKPGISNTRKFGPVGFELAITKMLVEMMHGTITVTSVPNRGTVFQVVLPLPVASPSPVTASGETCLRDIQIPNRIPAIILLAEDNKINQKLISTILSKKGHHVDIANNGREAVDRVKEYHYDLILMDIQMPVMDGLDAAKAIRGLGFVDLPIIALTANVFQEDKEVCLESGMNDFLPKPLRQADLLKLIAKWVSEKNHCDGCAVTDCQFKEQT